MTNPRVSEADVDESTTKSCTRCDVVKALSEFHRDASSRDGRTGQCKECGNEAARIRTQVQSRREPRPVATKKCRKCGEVKAAAEFHKRAASPDGLQLTCRPCNCAASLAYKRANPDKVAAYAKTWQARNPDAKAEASRRWRALNPDRAREASAKWERDNPEQAKANKHRWYILNRSRVLTAPLRHPERVAASASRYRVRNREVLVERQARRRVDRLGGTLEQVDLSTLPASECGICRQALDLAKSWPDPMSKSLDHIVPLSKGGTHLRSNLQWSHLSCNIRKGARLVFVAAYPD